MNELLDVTLLENGEELGAEYEAWLDEVEAEAAYRAEIAARRSAADPVSMGVVLWEGRETIFIDDFPVRADEIEAEEDDLVF